MKLRVILCLALAAFAVTGCVTMKNVQVDSFDQQFTDKYYVETEELQVLHDKPMYEFSPNELDVYLRYCQERYPNVRDRAAHLARKHIGEKYEYFLLGEFPFEVYDSAPLFKLKNSDCVTYVEKIYAMTFSKNWPTFFAMLQRIRYKNGEIGYLTRNHWSLADWDVNNSWLVEDICQPGKMDEKYLQKISVKMNKAPVFRRRTEKYHEIGQDLKPFPYETWFVPLDQLDNVYEYLQPGDLVNIIRGHGGPGWCGHFGLVMVDDQGRRCFLDSSGKGVSEDPFEEVVKNYRKWNIGYAEHNAKCDLYRDEIKQLKKDLKDGGFHPLKKWRYKKIKKYARKKASIYGIKFLRLREDALDRLVKLDGKDAPLVTATKGLLFKDDIHLKENEKM